MRIPSGRTKHLGLAYFLFMLCLGGVGDLYASPTSGPTGKVAGRVIEAGTDLPLPGVNVVLQGTSIGAVTDTDGYYHILNVPPSTYSVQASFIGFATVTIQNIRVVQDQTSTVNFELREELIEGEELVVVAERPIVEMDRTTTTSVIDAEQLEVLPVTNVQDAINLQAGVVDGHFRGGRIGEVTYLVNGVPITNAFSKEAAFDIEQNMVQSLEVISGVFNAEYGQATSGVVNIVTKDVPDQWSGSLLTYAGAIASNRELEFIDRTSSAGPSLSISDFTADTVSYAEASALPNLIDVQASLGGPLIKERLGFQTTVRYLQDNSHFIGRNLFAPSDSSQNLNTGLPPSIWTIASTGNGDFVPRNRTDRISINASIGYSLTSRLKLDYNAFLQSGTFQPYSHFRKYTPDGINTVHFFNQTHILGIRFTASSNSFANLSYSYLHDKTDVYLYESPFDLRHVSSDFGFLQGANAFAVAGNDLSQSDQLTATHTVVADYSHQLNRIHLFKVGVQARLHSLDNRDFGIERSFRTFNLPQPSPDQFSDNTLNAQPVELSAYIQDKMEFTGLIVNAGLRFDYFDPDYLSPIVWGQGELEEIPDPENPGSTRSNREPAKIDMQLSPRLGVAFPISETGVMRFSAGLFFQIPSFGLLYTNPEYEINPASLSNSFGNPGINPERTLSFEIGLQQGFTSRIGMEITVYSRDVRNLTGQEISRTPQGDFVIRWINRDYGTIRGMTFSLFQRPGGRLSWTLDYTLQFAEGTSSSPGEAFGRQQAGLDEILSLVRLDWDRRHVLNNTITFEPFQGLSITLINRLQSGTPYTTVREFIRSGKKNNATKPMIFGTDMRMYYRIPGLRPNIQMFFQAQNLFDTVQEVGVYEDTGRADESVTLELFRRTGAQVGGLNSLDEFFYRQENFGAPRKVSLGLNYRF